MGNAMVSEDRGERGLEKSPPASPGAAPERPSAPVPPAKEPPSTDWAPKPKVAAAATTIPFSGLVLWIAGELGLDMPFYVAGDVAILIALAVAYLTPDR